MLKVMAHPNKLVRVGSTPSITVTRNGTRNGTTWGKMREPLLGSNQELSKVPVFQGDTSIGTVFPSCSFSTFPHRSG